MLACVKSCAVIGLEGVIVSVEVDTADGLPGKTFQGSVNRLSPRMTSKKIWSDDPAERFDTNQRRAKPGSSWISAGIPACSRRWQTGSAAARSLKRATRMRFM